MHIHICQNITLQTSELHSPVIKLDFVYVNFWHSYFIMVFCNILQPVGGGCLGCIFHPSTFQSKGSHQALPVCFFQKNKSAICFLYWLHFLIDKQLKAEIHMPVFFSKYMPPTLCWQQFPSMEIHFRDVFWLHNFIHGNCTAEVSINSCLFFFNQQITMSFFVDSIFSPIEISRQRFASNPALEVLFCKSTKSMCLKNIYTSTSYILVSWFFCKIFLEKQFSLFMHFLVEKLGRIRGVSEPYQSRIRAKLKIFHFFWGIGFFFFVFLVALLCFYLRAMRVAKKNTCHCQTLNSFQQSKSV